MIKLLDNKEHDRLVNKLRILPFSDAQAKVYKNSLDDLFLQYEKQIEALCETVSCYEEVAELVRNKAPLQNPVKYIKVRKLNHAKL